MLKNTFVEKGLRLLVPVVMERELIRHYQEQAKECAEAVAKVQNEYPVPFLKLWAPDKNEVASKCLNELTSQWEQFKSHFTVEKLPLVGDLEAVVDWYFNVNPPFADSKKKRKEFPDAFILSVLDAYHNKHNASIAVVSADKDFEKACEIRSYLKHFNCLKEYIDAFKPELTKEDYFTAKPVDPTQPIVTEDLTELKAILGRGSEATSVEIGRVIKLLQSRGENYRYFFKSVDEPMWLPHLERRSLFDNLPAVEQMEDGSFQIPDWPPIRYLERIFESVPADREKVLGILEGLPESSNPRVLEGIVSIILMSDNPDDLMRFSERIMAFVDHCRWSHEKIIQLLDKLSLTDKSLAGFSESFLFKVVGFQSDPEVEVKQEHDKAEPESQATLAEVTDFKEYKEAREKIDQERRMWEPRPRFDKWEYQEILGKGVRPLADREPYRTARILIDAMAGMIRLGFNRNQLESVGSKDYSIIWCERVHETEKDYKSSKESLVHTLTFACEKVYEQAPESVLALDQVLRGQRWNIFTRIRQHLYALYPGKQTKPWIREMILSHEDYDKWEHHFEFQRMIRFSCEKPGADFLTTEEREQIFEKILKGPSKQNFQEWEGDRFTEELFEQKKRHFHKMQLRPFAPILFGEYADYYFQKLEDKETKLIDDDDYAPRKSEGAKWVENRSPEPAEELKKMSDEQLLAFLNDWDNAHDDPEKWWVHITFEGLAQEFRSIFKEVILADEARIRFWIANRDRIKRPIYVQAIMSALHEHIKLKQFDMLDLWFEFCKWVLSHPDRPREKGINRSDQSGEHPDWQNSRREVGDFVETCLKEDINVPIKARDSLVFLLDRLCSQYDRQLDEEEPVLLSGNDQLTEAINNTRSRALKSLVDFGYWVRRQSGNNQADTPEVFDILDKRLGPECDHLLTLPEYAILGSCYGHIWGLNQEWATQHKSDLFPQGKLQAWTEAFGNFLRYSQPYKPIFDIVQTDIKFALENIDEFNTDSYGRTNLIGELGKHLFTYYLWRVYPLTGGDSLLERFYEKTQVARWSYLFDYVGRSLENSGELLQEGLEEKIKEFFDWRLEQGEPFELKEFAVWLKAKCLAAEWRLKSYSKALDVLLRGSGDIETYHEMDTLYRMLDKNTALVTECFAKLTGFIAENESTGYINVDQARSIIQAGLSNNDDTVKSNAEQAQENLLRCGHSSLLD